MGVMAASPKMEETRLWTSCSGVSRKAKMISAKEKGVGERRVYWSVRESHRVSQLE